MPHVHLERLRHWPRPWAEGPPRLPLVRRKDSPLFAYCLDISEIIAAIIFVLGSVCFLPSYAQDLNIFLAGCALFIVGAIIYALVCHVCHFEAVVENGPFSYEAQEHALYTIGSWIFLVGTILYWPEEAHHKTIEALQGCSLGQYYNLFTPEFEGTVLFIVGSVLFFFASVINALNQKRYDEDVNQMLVAINAFQAAGSVLFVVGSVLFLPDLGCAVLWLSIGAWCFIIGSALFLVASVMSFCRTVMLQSAEQEERRGLVAKDAKDAAA